MSHVDNLHSAQKYKLKSGERHLDDIILKQIKTEGSRSNTLVKNNIFHQFQTTLKEANQDLIEIENLDSQKNSVSFIKEYFEKIKRKVNMRRDVLKVKIDLYSDRIIQTIDKTE